jgi:Holliday junction resolvase
VKGGRAPKQKGTSFERECVDTFKEAGWEAKRAWGSNGRALGLTEDVDILAKDWKIQCKRKARIAEYVKPSGNVDAVLIREDRGETLIVLRLSKFLEAVV